MAWNFGGPFAQAAPSNISGGAWGSFSDRRPMGGDWLSGAVAGASNRASFGDKTRQDNAASTWGNATNQFGNFLSGELDRRNEMAAGAINNQAALRKAMWETEASRYQSEQMAKAYKSQKPSTFGSLLGAGMNLAGLAFLPKAPVPKTKGA
jgi:hypothetical protein